MLFRKAPQILVGPLLTAHIPACAAIHASAFHRGWDQDEFAALLRDPAVIAQAARDARGPAPLGFAIARHTLDEAEILTIAVQKSSRGAGIATRLLDECLAQLSQAGAERVFLEVDAGNKPALALYARAGFKQVGERKGYYRNDDGAPATALILLRDGV